MPKAMQCPRCRHALDVATWERLRVEDCPVDGCDAGLGMYRLRDVDQVPTAEGAVELEEPSQ